MYIYILYKYCTYINISIVNILYTHCKYEVYIDCIYCKKILYVNIKNYIQVYFLTIYIVNIYIVNIYIYIL